MKLLVLRMRVRAHERVCACVSIEEDIYYQRCAYFDDFVLYVSPSVVSLGDFILCIIA